MLLKKKMNPYDIKILRCIAETPIHQKKCPNFRESPQMWVWPQLVFGGSPPSPHCNWRTLPSSQSPSLPALSLPLPPTPLALFAMLRESGTGRPSLVWGEESQGGWRGRGLQRYLRYLGPDPHLGVLDPNPSKNVRIFRGACMVKHACHPCSEGLELDALYF